VSVSATAFRNSAYCEFVTSYVPMMYGSATAPKQPCGWESQGLPGSPTNVQSMTMAVAEPPSVSAIHPTNKHNVNLAICERIGASTDFCS
jgi:hypothetical protein